MTEFWSPVWLSIKVAFVSGSIVIFFGTVIAKWMARRRFRGKIVIETLLMLPLVLPPSVVGFLLIILFGRNSMIGKGIEALFHAPIMFTWYAAVIAASVVSFPLMYQSAKAGLEAIDEMIEEAARVDGANEYQVFWHISIPLAKKALISGAILAFARSLGEFGATLMFAGNIPGKTQTIPTAIYVAIESGKMDLAWAWVAVTMVLSFFLLLCATSFKSHGKEKAA
ncbi:molybdate ABC transporter permease subunit [Parageobacillus thermoglucosidasius]|uniref:molybdate ABC transporter permease subunit n=1 Tax=Parageobacillus thermoglucosidasius TaxID=1426 RepID=UPI0001D175DE|nr:molybdate ABC transporter permease subunit [Parageobacillus thermoglucosidasius]AEH48957.1 molybdate ABC transporter, inner membrane subunit [Parageobacillus thermoglucosidasius C56-YS93]MED4903131.1 molybdate ABC transporter permease subunit [Parageobacillus thermoglucosidasius]MED4915076.1 molybdate ABC transporter permease subunit [Parageobacillus thermoglucosidasius]MED4946035.1 molybdate ABC transporter permease subunit [Parageobacillus thermoglucosidasius]MED4981597.1 molybdate ABC tr